MANLDVACSCGPKTVEDLKAQSYCPTCNQQYNVRVNTKHYERKNQYSLRRKGCTTSLEKEKNDNK